MLAFMQLLLVQICQMLQAALAIVALLIFEWQIETVDLRLHITQLLEHADVLDVLLVSRARNEAI